MEKFTILLLLKATPLWLSLSRKDRKEFTNLKIFPIIQKFKNEIQLRMYDAEYFHAEVSDFMIVETTQLQSYQLFIEMLRDTDIYGKPYFEIKEIILGQENAYQHFDQILN